MRYIYLPDSYDYNLINLKFNDFKEFVDLQVLYRNCIEKILMSNISFIKLEEYILSQGVDIPKVDDKEYNFYHKYSTLGSDYIFLRNNIHIERLSREELERLKSNSNLDINFYLETIAKVLFEAGDETFFGPAIAENSVKSNSLVFEFSFDQSKCSSLGQLNKIHEIIEKIFKMMDKELKEKLNLESSFIIYRAIPDYYYSDSYPLSYNLIC